jgi:hypothetical protein
MKGLVNARLGPFSLTLAAALFWACSALAQPTIVQQAAGGLDSETTGGVVLPNVVVGDTLVFAITGAIGYIPTVTDSAGNAWKVAITLQPPLTNGYTALWYAPNVKAGDTTISIVYNGTQWSSWNAFEVSGLTGAIDTATSSYSFGTSTAVSTGALTTTVSGDLLVGVMQAGWGNPPPFTDIGTSGGTPTMLEWDPNSYADMFGAVG